MAEDGNTEADRTLDITRDLCPMTFVRTRLALDRMAPGETLLVVLKGEEPRRNVPRSASTATRCSRKKPGRMG